MLNLSEAHCPGMSITVQEALTVANLPVFTLQLWAYQLIDSRYKSFDVVRSPPFARWSRESLQGLDEALSTCSGYVCSSPTGHERNHCQTCNFLMLGSEGPSGRFVHDFPFIERWLPDLFLPTGVVPRRPFIHIDIIYV